LKSLFLIALWIFAASFSFAQLPYTDEQVIKYAKSIDVQTLDPSLPSQCLEDWLQSGPPHAHIGSWKASDSCDLKDPEFEFRNLDWPTCVRVSFYRDGLEGHDFGQESYLLIQVGNHKAGITGPPRLNQPFSVWEGTMSMTGGSERLSDLPPLLDQPVVTAGVQKLFDAVVAHHPIGIPTGTAMAAINPYLSKRLAAQLQTARSCQDYWHQHPSASKDLKPGWLRSGIFSGEGSHASPVNAFAASKKKQSDGSYLVTVVLEPADAVIRGHKPTAFHGGYAWQVEALVISEAGRFLVDDVRVFDFLAEGPSHLLSDSLSGCDGSRWTGLSSPPH